MKDTAKLSELSIELSCWLEDQLVLLAEYAGSLGVYLDQPLTSEHMDDLWLAWKAKKVNDSDAIDSFLNCFGIGFGQILVDRLGFDWTFLEDAFGTDIAVRAFPGIADTRIAPLHFVLKRWESNEGSFITASIIEIDKHMDEHAKEHGIER